MGTTWKHTQAPIEVLQLLHPKLAEGSITHYCGMLKGTIEGGFEILFSYAHVGCSLNDI
jgi:hypothetical protein